MTFPKIKKALEKRRKALGMTYAALAVNSGLTLYTVRKVCQGGNSKMVHLLTICRVMGLGVYMRFE